MVSPTAVVKADWKAAKKVGPLDSLMVVQTVAKMAFEMVGMKAAARGNYWVDSLDGY